MKNVDKDELEALIELLTIKSKTKHDMSLCLNSVICESEVD